MHGRKAGKENNNPDRRGYAGPFHHLGIATYKRNINYNNKKHLNTLDELCSDFYRPSEKFRHITMPLL
jgi:hypothetical protein